MVKVSSYIPTFTNLLNPSEYASLLVSQINGKFYKRTKTKKAVLNALKKIKNKKKNKKTSKGKKVTCSPIFSFCAFLCVKFSPKKTTKKFKIIWANKNKEDNIFIRIKTSKKRKIACLTFRAFCASYASYDFYARKKRLSESRFFAFCAFCAFCAFFARETFL